MKPTPGRYPAHRSETALWRRPLRRFARRRAMPLLSVSRSGARARPRGPTPPQPVVPAWIFVSTSYIPPVGKTCFGSVGPSWKRAALGEGALPGKCSFANPVGARAIRRTPSVRPRHAPPTAGFTTLGPAGAEGLDDRPPGRARLPRGDRAREVGRGRVQRPQPADEGRLRDDGGAGVGAGARHPESPAAGGGLGRCGRRRGVGPRASAGLGPPQRPPAASGGPSLRWIWCSGRTPTAGPRGSLRLRRRQEAFVREFVAS